MVTFEGECVTFKILRKSSRGAFLNKENQEKRSFYIPENEKPGSANIKQQKSYKRKDHGVSLCWIVLHLRFFESRLGVLLKQGKPGEKSFYIPENGKPDSADIKKQKS